jgi:hypothetical protein
LVGGWVGGGGMVDFFQLSGGVLFHFQDKTDHMYASQAEHCRRYITLN